MFTIIGERINTTLKKVRQAVEERDAAYIKADVRSQTAAGATSIDVNAGARCMDNSGMPANATDIVDRAVRLADELNGIGMVNDDIFIDPMIQPISVNTSNCRMLMEAIGEILNRYQELISPAVCPT